MSNYKPGDFVTSKDHDPIVTIDYKVTNGYPNIFKRTGIPLYLCLSGVITEEKRLNYLNGWIEKTKKDIRDYETTFRKLKRNTVIKMADRSLWRVTRIKVGDFDNQIVYINSLGNPIKRKKYLLHEFLYLICEWKAWTIVK